MLRENDLNIYTSNDSVINGFYISWRLHLIIVKKNIIIYDVRFKIENGNEFFFPFTLNWSLSIIRGGFWKHIPGVYYGGYSDLIVSFDKRGNEKNFQLKFHIKFFAYCTQGENGIVEPIFFLKFTLNIYKGSSFN